MEAIPGVVPLQSVLETSLGLDAWLARGIALVFVAVLTLALVSVITVVVLDDSKPSSGSSRHGKTAASASGGGKPSVVLIGPSLSGKTALFHRLCTGNLPRTVRSLESSSAAATVTAAGPGGEKSVDVRIVDMPGHERAAGREELAGLLRASTTRLVLIVVDASSKDSVRRGARTLAELLSSASFVDSGASVCVVGSRAEAVVSSSGATSSRDTARAALLAAVEAEVDNIRHSEATVAREAGSMEEEVDRIALGSMTDAAFSLARDSPLREPVKVLLVSNTAETGALAGQEEVRQAVVAALNE